MKSSRTLKMMEEFMPLHNAGHSVQEIAKLTGVEFSTVYRYLGEIAEQNGVTRESLLLTPHPNYSRREGSPKMGIYRLRGKTMHELAKRGLTKADICAKYQCTEDELVAQIRKIFCDDTRAVNEMLNELTFNEKHAAKKAKVTEKPAEPAISKEKPASDIGFVTDIQSTHVLTDAERREAKLSELKSKRQELLKESEEVAKQYAEADRNYGKCCNELSEHGREIGQLTARLLALKTKCDEINADSRKYLNEREIAKTKREHLVHEIAAISLEISDLMAVQLIACDDGTIEAIDAPDFVMNEEGADKYYGLLVHDLQCSEFRMKDISLLARAMAIRQNSEDRRVVVTFDDERLTQYFAAT